MVSQLQSQVTSKSGVKRSSSLQALIYSSVLDKGAMKSLMILSGLDMAFIYLPFCNVDGFMHVHYNLILYVDCNNTC